MLKNLCSLVHTVEGKVYHLLCDNDSPLPHVKESLFQFLNYIGKIEEATKAAAEAAKEQVKEAVVDEVLPPLEDNFDDKIQSIQ